MNAELPFLLQPLPHLPPLDDGSAVSRLDAASSAFLDRVASERRAEARRQSMRRVIVPGDVFEELDVYLVG